MVSCPDGTTSVTGAARVEECFPCPTGRTADGNGDCTWYAAGYSADGPCPTGWWSIPGPDPECVLAAEGYYVNGDTVSVCPSEQQALLDRILTLDPANTAGVSPTNDVHSPRWWVSYPQRNKVQRD